ncbi:hypothetical protein CSAL01_09891 [Colletotrichum salicis]|uniref:Uncharacterized protein n=1 Tax=Colletotrichum salicis TaxID=1209931 RepID=A0A135U9Q7_9PEZI|nr:hypothetical protein CSAL01_09891 [Colletotrichum salicis]
MKSFTVMAIALLGLTNAATIRICKDQTLGNCVTMDVTTCTAAVPPGPPEASRTPSPPTSTTTSAPSSAREIVFPLGKFGNVRTEQLMKTTNAAFFEILCHGVQQREEFRGYHVIPA